MNESIVTVEVALPGREYPIDIGSGAIGQMGRRLRERSTAGRATVVTDSNVGPLYGEQVAAALRAGGFEAAVLTVPAGEGSKSLEEAGRLYGELAKRRHDRREPVVALGGGVVGDLAGFVAATWLRGVPFVQCPTTLAADVDASIGGKTAVNHPAGKNLIGAFHQPVMVCIDLDCLKTLSRRDYCAGLAESVKHAIIRDAAFFDWQESRRADILAGEAGTVKELIRRNCQNKAAVVVADERETEGGPRRDSRSSGGGSSGGVGRAALNFGHTIGHALEAQSNFELRHGEAVSLGMVAAMDLAVGQCGFPESDRARAEALLAAFELPIREADRERILGPAAQPLDVADLFRRLGLDKKARDQTVRFVLPPRLGEVRWLEGPPVEAVERAIRRVAGG